MGTPALISEAQPQVFTKWFAFMDEVFNIFVTFTDDMRDADFSSSKPVNKALGADLALMTGADALSFDEKDVIIGRFRTPKTDRFQLDAEGDKRLESFMKSVWSRGNPVSFQQVGEKIKHYAELFGEISDDSHPVAIYVGSAPSLNTLCSDWRNMTREVARLSGRPRVFGIVFENKYASDIDSLLERSGSRTEEEPLARRTRAFTCDGENGSKLLIVPFPDLVSRNPPTVLDPAFSKVRGWMAQTDKP
jgi:hypothetical protein